MKSKLYIFETKSFISTSINRNIAKRFSECDCCLCIYILDVGIPYISIFLSNYSGEDEVLLPPDLNFELIKTDLEITPNEYTIKVSLKNKYQFSQLKKYYVY